MFSSTLLPPQMSTTGLVLVFVGMCLCQQSQQSANGSPSQYQSTLSQGSFQTGSAAQQPQTKLEDIERDSLATTYGQKTLQQSGKSSATDTATVSQPQQSQQQTYQTAAAPQQAYFLMQPYQVPQQQYYVQPYQMAFDYNGVQYMIVSPNAYNPVAGNQVYQQYYSGAPQPSAIPQYVTKQSSPTAPAQVQQEHRQQFTAPALAQQEYKQPQFTIPALTQQQYKQQQFAAPTQAQQEYKQQYQYVQQPAAPAVGGPIDFSYVTRHPAAQFKAPAAAIQPQFQYTAIPQQYQQPTQFYYNLPAGPASTEQPRIQQSAKSQFSSGVKSTTPTPLKESFAYKFESSPIQSQQQQSGSAYSTLRYSA